MVAWHEPYWTSDSVERTRTLAVKPWVVHVLDKYDVPLLLNGHQHRYARSYSQSAGGSRNDATGIQEFIVGTGGIGFYNWTSTAANVATQQRHLWVAQTSSASQRLLRMGFRWHRRRQLRR